MRKNISQITVAIVCAFLGFMLTYEFKLLNAENNNLSSAKDLTKGSEISEELESVKKQRLELQIKNNEISNQLKKYEENITNLEEIKNQVNKEVRDSEILLGSREVEGAGIVLTFVPNGESLLEDDSNDYINDEQLIYIVNELKFAGAEAIAINDKRITSQSGIKSAENNNYILINGEKISPKLKIEIKVIGDKVKLQSALTFANTLENVVSHIGMNSMDSIKIPKYNRGYNTSHLKIKE